MAELDVCMYWMCTILWWMFNFLCSSDKKRVVEKNYVEIN